VLEEIVQSGNELGNHSYSHPDLARLEAAEIRNELTRTNAVVGPNSHFRPPYGTYNSQVLKMAGELGYHYTALWNVDPRDWSGIKASSVTSNVVSAVAPGSIVVLHDQFKATVDALPDILEGLKTHGLSAVTLSTLISAGSPTI